jgi:hypothetical protein
VVVMVVVPAASGGYSGVDNDALSPRPQYGPMATPCA